MSLDLSEDMKYIPLRGIERCPVHVTPKARDLLKKVKEITGTKNYSQSVIILAHLSGILEDRE